MEAALKMGFSNTKMFQKVLVAQHLPVPIELFKPKNDYHQIHWMDMLQSKGGY